LLRHIIVWTVVARDVLVPSIITTRKEEYKVEWVHRAVSIVHKVKAPERCTKALVERDGMITCQLP